MRASNPYYAPKVPKVLHAGLILGLLVLSWAAYLRFHHLGARSLWADELCTWKAATMPFRQSLTWQPELTKPPLYQIAVRAVSKVAGTSERIGRTHPIGRNAKDQDAPPGLGAGSAPEAGPGRKGVPDEWHLRLPAAVAGVLAVAAIAWLGGMAGGWTVALAAAALLACNDLQIQYSREARPYSLLVLGGVVSSALWIGLLSATRRGGGAAGTSDRSRVSFRKDLYLYAGGYVLVSVLAFHANYLILLTVAAHVAWAAGYLVRGGRMQGRAAWAAPVSALGAAGILCVPMVGHFLRHRTSVFQGLGWIPAPTWADAFKVLGNISFGPVWVWALLLPALSVLLAWRTWKAFHERSTARSAIASSSHREVALSIVSLLLIWLITAWLGLMLISRLAHPAMVARYALPAAAPAILLPLIVFGRLDRRIPLLIAALVVAVTAGTWTSPGDVKPGFRELVAFLDEYADPLHEAVVIAIERSTSPGWEEMDLLGFEYYPSLKFELPKADAADHPPARQPGDNPTGSPSRPERDASPHRRAIELLHLRNGKPDGDQPVLRDPRALWMVNFLADPTEALAAAGRRIEKIQIEDDRFSQLLFTPYRLIRVAALPEPVQ